MKIKLSTAIREGAKLRPQTVGRYFKLEGDQVCSCAIGAALEHLGIEAVPTNSDNDDVEQKLFDTFGFNGEVDNGDMWYRVTRLNDADRMSREQIANILEKEGL